MLERVTDLDVEQVEQPRVGVRHVIVGTDLGDTDRQGAGQLGHQLFARGERLLALHLLRGRRSCRRRSRPRRRARSRGVRRRTRPTGRPDCGAGAGHGATARSPPRPAPPSSAGPGRGRRDAGTPATGGRSRPQAASRGSPSSPRRPAMMPPLFDLWIRANRAGTLSRSTVRSRCCGTPTTVVGIPTTMTTPSVSRTSSMCRSSVLSGDAVRVTTPRPCPVDCICSKTVMTVGRSSGRYASRPVIPPGAWPGPSATVSGTAQGVPPSLTAETRASGCAVNRARSSTAGVCAPIVGWLTLASLPGLPRDLDPVHRHRRRST